MHAEYAYAQGFTGKGVNVGVFDSGLYAPHPKFQDGRFHPVSTIGTYYGTGALNDGSGANYDDPGSINYAADARVGAFKKGESFNVSGTFIDGVNNTHGTHVSGSIGASRNGDTMHGVAFGADVYVANTNGTDDNVFQGPDFLDYGYFKAAYHALASQGVRMVNNSWGQNSSNPVDNDMDSLTSMTAAYRRFWDKNQAGSKTWLDAMGESIKENGFIQVVAAGNSGGTLNAAGMNTGANPDMNASLPYFRPELETHWLAVAAADPGTDANGNVVAGKYGSIASYSNQCGVAKYWCVDAPGSSILSTINPNYPFNDPDKNQLYESADGTSMSTPHASGALAVIMERFPYMTNEQALSVLLTTAGHDGVMTQSPSAVDGWGNIDMLAAMKGPGQLFGKFAANLPAGVTDTWSNDITDNALIQRKQEDDAEHAVWIQTLKNKGWQNGLPAGAGADDQFAYAIGSARENAYEQRAYAGSLTVTGPGTLVLTGADTWRGVTEIDAGRLVVDGSLASPTTIPMPVMINAGGVLAGKGVITGNVSNAGVISPGSLSDASAHGTLTIRGNYQGNGGLLKLNTMLGTDDSLSDKLVIDGSHGAASATGNTNVLVTNAGGAGAQTNQNGIMIVQALGLATTSAAAFSLPGGVRAGAYDYRLFRGGLQPTDSTAQQDWFLRSTFVDNTSAPVNASPSTPTSAAATIAHIVGPELSVYGSAAPTAQWLTLSTLGTWHERNGDGTSGQTDSTSDDRHAWARVIGQSFNAQFTSPVSPSTSGTLTGVQAGTDVWHGNDGLIGGKDRVGAYFSYAHANADVQGLVTNAGATANAIQDTGNISLDGWSLATYWTHTGNSGWYTDLVAQATVYSGRAGSDRTSISLHGHGMTGSLEFGYPIALTSHWSIEPRAQIVAQRVQLSAEQDAFGAVSPGNTSGVFGSMGLRTQYTFDMGAWTLQPYAFANLWSSLGSVNGATVYAGSDQVTTDSGARWLQLGGGLSAKVSDRVSLFARLSGEVNMGNNPRHGIDGDAGVRVVW